MHKLDVHSVFCLLKIGFDMLFDVVAMYERSAFDGDNEIFRFFSFESDCY